MNVVGTLNALLAARDGGASAFVFASSGAPLGSVEPPGHEGLAPRPLSPYGASKLAGEGLCSAFAGSYGLPATALRFTNVYGPYSYHKGSVVAAFMKRIMDGEPLVVYGDGNQTRDFLYVDDLCRAVIAVLDRRPDGRAVPARHGHRDVRDRAGQAAGRDLPGPRRRDPLRAPRPGRSRAASRTSRGRATRWTTGRRWAWTKGSASRATGSSSSRA